ncbi:hypothetical protein D9613_004120 [Agrocybe pediades]|uniref:Uncharacterized protein n=1 Tax=Agrocybe pediades TaxID=84607 RepID=A0A8H4QJB7_9AGAR|nr:hypothetical protein D9613_004120 [Agrocybe pediades]
MFVHHHLPSSLRRPCLRSLPRLVASTSSAGQYRPITSSISRRAEVSETIAQENEIDEELPQIEDMATQNEGENTEKGPATYREFLEKIGNKYKFTNSKPRNWLSPNAPFPMNPSFKPPPPISNTQKTWMFDKFFGDPLKHSPRKLAGSLNMSLKRVDAILRLKGLERQFQKVSLISSLSLFDLQRKNGRMMLYSRLVFKTPTWYCQGDFLFPIISKSPLVMMRHNLHSRNGRHSVVPYIARNKGIPLQTGFQTGMEQLLGVYTHPTVSSDRRGGTTVDHFSRSDVDQADSLERAEKRDAARYRYERLYWESTPEDGREPVLPGILEDVKNKVHLKELAGKQRASRFLPKRLPRNPWVQRPATKSFIVTRTGRVPTRFVDVGADLLNVVELVKREKVHKHRLNHLRRRSASKNAQETS